MLFENYIRTNSEPKKRFETNYEFLNRSSWNISELARQILNELSNSYNTDKEFIKMFKSKSNKQHSSAIFELLTHGILKNSKFNLVRHPETTTPKKPDFLARKDNYELFIECTLAGNSFESLEDKNRKETVEDIIDQIEYFPYWINLDFLTISKKSISKNKLIRFIKNVSQNNSAIIGRNLYSEDGWKIEVSLTRKNNLKIKRSLGCVSEKPKIIDTVKPILGALNDKIPSRYGLSDSYYIIFLNTNDLFTHESCFGEALFGSFFNDGTVRLKNSIQAGFYLNKSIPINTSVSAVVIFRNFDIFTLDNALIRIWHNPFAQKELPENILPFDEYIFDQQGDYLKREILTKECDVFDLLNINKHNYIKLKDKS